jgi:hypothetical protein
METKTSVSRHSLEKLRFAVILSLRMNTKPEKPILAFFSAQFNGQLVGPDNVFKTFEDLCKFAHDECGYNGVSLHTGMLDIEQINESHAYCEDLIAKFRNLGTPIVNLANHVVGQLVCVHQAVLPRFIGFAPDQLRDASVHQVQAWAALQMQKEILATYNLGLHHLHTFPGGKSVPVATDPWNAYPPQLREKALAILADSWEPNLSYAGGLGVKIGFEFRHIMEDLIRGQDMIDLRDIYILDAIAKTAVDTGTDYSHFQIDGDDPRDDSELVFNARMWSMNHAKFGFFDATIPGHCRRPANMPWSERAGKFCTFGIHNPEHARHFIMMVDKVHEREPEGTYIVVEGECMYLRNPKQGLSIAANNVRLVQAGKEPINFRDIEPLPWSGPAFDSFADSGYTAEQVMALDVVDSAAVRDRLAIISERQGK